MIQNEDLLINRQLRNDLITEERLDVLDKVKELNCLPNTTLSTVEQVANYYEVGNSAISSLIFDNKEEIELDGCKTYKGKEISQSHVFSYKNFTQNRANYKFILDDDKELSVGGKGIVLFPKRAVLRIGMLLTESEIARQIRNELLIVNPMLYAELSKESCLRFKKYEEEMGNYLAFTFGDENIKKQVFCGKYKLDFVLFDIVHIEVDENGHQNYDKDKEEERTQYILENTEYWTMRYNPMKQKPYEIIKEIFDLFDNIGYPDELIKELVS